MSPTALIGRYEILQELGQGAMGVVYKGRDPMMNRPVAIKRILSAALSSPMADEYGERFRCLWTSSEALGAARSRRKPVHHN